MRVKCLLFLDVGEVPKELTTYFILWAGERKIGRAILYTNQKLQS